MSLDKIYVHVNVKRNTNGLLYTAISRVTDPEGLLISDFDAALFDRIVKSKRMKRMKEELANLADLTEKTTKWVEEQGIRDMFDFYFDKRHYKTRTHVPITVFPIHVDSVSAAMDITNYMNDIFRSTIVDHTFAQDCA